VNGSAGNHVLCFGVYSRVPTELATFLHLIARRKYNERFYRQNHVMPKKYANRAIIVLEAPWNLDETDANRSSVLPFLQGVAKLAGDTDVLHANFYDESSLIYAYNHLAKSHHKNAIMYIAAHGAYGEVGNVELSSIFAAAQVIAKRCNITGVLIGSCYSGECDLSLQAGIERSQLRWCAGYASSANWLQGTMVDCAILEAMLDLPSSAYKKSEKMIERLAQAISPFSSRYAIGDDYDDQPVSLRDSLQFVIQPEGQGQRARNVSQEVFDMHAALQLDSDDEDDGDDD